MLRDARNQKKKISKLAERDVGLHRIQQSARIYKLCINSCKITSNSMYTHNKKKLDLPLIPRSSY